MTRNVFFALFSAVVLCFSQIEFVEAKTAVVSNQTEESQTEEEETNDVDFLTVLQIPERENAEVLTLEEAIEKAVKNSSALKQANNSLKLSEKKVDRASTTYLGSVSGESLSNLMSLIQQNANYSTSLISKEIQEGSLEYSMKKTYIEIINTEREIALEKISLANDLKQLTVTREKAKLGLISEKELSDAELAYQTSLVNMQSKQKALEEAYTTFDTLIGNTKGTVYQLTLEPKYEKLELTVPIESYAISKAAKDLNVQKLKKEVEVAQENKKTVNVNMNAGVDSVQEADNSLATAQMNLSDTREELENKITSCYNSILQNEKEYDNAFAELENLKKSYEINENKLELGLITQLELEQTKEQIAQKESSIIQLMYEHMLLTDQLENTYLL